MSARTLQQLVAAAASLHPDRAAVTYSGSASGAPVTLLYRDVAQLADELSGVLRKNCSANNGLIGLYGGDDVLIPVWILGILQSAAAYVPLDPEAPGFLSARVMKQCGLKYCAVKTDLLQQFQTALIKHITVEVYVELTKFKLTLIRIEPLPVAEDEQGSRSQTSEDTAVLKQDAGCRDLAYVLHTSGTTGLPKTVRVPHKCILPNILHLRSLFQMCSDDVVFLASPLTFDPSVVDIFLALSSGARLLIVPAVIKKIPNRLAKLLFKDHKTTVLQVTPTLLLRFGHRILKQDVFSSGSSLRVLALGGEACPSPALLRSWRHEDNKTHIYNIYGITEVSCWACCYKIPESLLQSNNHSVCSVPLGAPLMDTVVEVRDEHGCRVTEGEGQVFIGGKDRVCLLDDEDAVVAGTMRATGDWVTVKDAQLYYQGRKDRMIKRNGKRVNLHSLQQLMLSLPQVEACAVGLHEGFRLLAFIVASTSGDQSAASTPSSVQQRAEQTPSALAEHQEKLPSSAEHHLVETVDTDGDLKRFILSQLSLLLPPHSVPDTLVLVPALSLTSHGKVDMEVLMRIYERQKQPLESSWGDVSKLKDSLQALWQDTLGLGSDATVDEESNFLFSGGDSLKALRLCEDILSAVGVTSPELLEVILDGTFTDVLRHVAKLTPMLPLESIPSPPPEAKKRLTDSPSVVPAKKQRKDSPAVERLQVEKRAFKVVRRAGEMIELNFRQTEANKYLPSDKLGENNSSMKRLSLSLSWSSDTGRCVDASPVLLVEDGTDQSSKTTVFIGSHSHRMQALDLVTGSLLWERVLGDRIEASAAVSRCGTLVIVGCYDGCVHFLCCKSGKTRWTFETGDAVKSCPAVDPLTGLVIVGSHDGHVYALNPQVRRCVWKCHCGGGAVFSSPHLHSSHRRLYVSSLGGRLLCLDPDSGDVLWSYCRDVPFFSSPNSCSAHVVIGSVDGNICCLSNTGKLLWQFQTKAPVFSSPCVTPDQQRLLCGSHDGHLYCLNCADGSLVWTFQTKGKVYSSPCVFDGSAAGRTGALVGLASTDGTVWILDGQNGQMLASLALPGELFSSPVAWEQSLVIGCRNDYVYCLKLTAEEET
ncbi:beta-alanine-activating enzyme [Stegastes partitus]|uniref:Beta-alanine-activating enzyme n=1 Tax=Stegastes partitus TaxID=144197 RepID=A0A9Y4JPN4_9TELE|nr:PREDICTED: acyl-CoA synthetase family member 4 [Stegastes partitus]